MKFPSWITDFYYAYKIAKNITTGRWFFLQEMPDSIVDRLASKPLSGNEDADTLVLAAKEEKALRDRRAKP